MMKIVEKKTLADTQGTKVTQLKVVAPQIAQKALAGQFVVLIVESCGERIPLTVVSKTDIRFEMSSNSFSLEERN